MSNRMMTAISNRDGVALAKIYGNPTATAPGVVSSDAEEVVDKLFRQLKQVFPAASQTNLRTETDETAAKKQWIAAFAENGIRTRDQLSAGMQHARSSKSPFWPSPGQFIDWCKSGVSRAAGLPDADELYNMVMDYSARRGLFDSPEAFPWQTNAAYWMVTKLYSRMCGSNQTAQELKKSCEKELVSMSRKIEAGEPIPAPVVQIPKLHIPVTNEKGLDNIAELRKKLRIGKPKKAGGF